jgi:hypothetical protein
MLPALPGLVSVRLPANHRGSEYKPRNTVLANDHGEPLPAGDKQRFDILAYRMSFDVVHLLPNADAQMGLLLPPLGYVASVNGGVRCHYDAFVGAQLFRGIARVRVRSFDINNQSDEARALRRRGLNLRIRDRSPIPPRVRPGHPPAQPEGGWVCALGQAGWVGLYSRDASGRALSLTEDSTEYWVIVVAGLCDETTDDLEEDLQQQTLAGATLRELFVSGDGRACAMQIYRDLAQQNRARLLAEAVEAMGLELHDPSQLKLCAHPYQYTRQLHEGAEEAREWFGAGQRVPVYYKLPHESPAGCPPLPAHLRGFPLGEACSDLTLAQKFPQYIDDAQDVMTSDVLPLDGGDMLAVYSKCCSTRSARGVPYISGPGAPVVVFNTAGDSWENADKCHAFPAEGRYRYQPEKAAPLWAIWESRALAQNRLAKSTCRFHDPMEESARGLLQLGGPRRDKDLVPVDVNRRYGAMSAMAMASCFVAKPLLVRVSAADATGYVHEPPAGPARFRGACVDESGHRYI